MSSLSKLKNKAKNFSFWIKHPGAAALLFLSYSPMARAQAASSVETNTIQLIQYGADVLIALAGCTGVFYLFRAGRTVAAASRDSGRGDAKGTHVMGDIVAAAILFSIGVVIYIASNQFFSGTSSQPSLIAPNITPTQG